MHGKDGKVLYAVGISTPPPPEPCHPGCFPSGTRVNVAGGTKAIEELHAGDEVTSVGADGQPTRCVVREVFTTNNWLVELRTTAGDVLTTDAQPFRRPDGTYSRAGELKPGDRVLTWVDGQPRHGEVKQVAATGRRERVFNLILKDGSAFVAGGFVVRGKPPAEASAASKP